jgi:hypothetical protein
MIRLSRRGCHYALLLALAAGLLFVPAAPASAAVAADLDCTITVTTDINPPLTLRPRHSAFITHGPTGTAECTGTVDGQTVTGAGSFAIADVAFVVDCAEAAGSGTFVLRIPTTGGVVTVAGRTDFTSAGGITVHTGDLTGTSMVVAAVGDCVTTPLTSATAVLTVHVT